MSLKARLDRLEQAMESRFMACLLCDRVGYLRSSGSGTSPCAIRDATTNWHSLRSE